MPLTLRALFRVFFFVGVAALFSGCVTSKKYKMAKEGTPPAKDFDWKSSAPEADLVLQTVIVFKGPGSWKREARWDEYQLAITNPGATPLVINAALLTDLEGAPQEPGANPWALEKMSYTNWDKYGKNGMKLLAGAGVVALYGGAVMATGPAIMSMGTAAAAGGSAMVSTLIPIVAIVDITAVAIMNHNNKKKVVAEFDRRRLVLPLTVAPGETAKGSLFFPMTPGPQLLTLNGNSGSTPVALVVDLKPLAGLHLAAKAKK